MRVNIIPGERRFRLPAVYELSAATGLNVFLRKILKHCSESRKPAHQSRDAWPSERGFI